MYWLATSDKILVRVEIIASQVLVIVCNLVQVDLVPQSATNTTETFHELESFLGLVRNQLNLGAKVLVVDEQPVTKVLLTNGIQFYARRCILEVLRILCLLLIEIPYLCLAGGRVLHFIPSQLDLLEQQYFFYGAHFQGLHGIGHTENYHARVQIDLLEEVTNECLLFNESDVCQGIGGLGDCMV